jgi:hypothetical protein
MSSDVGILIGSCDSYADLWRPCVTLLERHWPDCPFPIFLGTDFKTFEHPTVKSLPVGAGLPWGASFRRQLEALPSTNVIYFVADFFLRKPVDTARVLQCLRLFHEMDAHCLRLSRPGYVLPIFETSLVGILPVGSPYRLSCNPSFWRKSTLLELLRDDDAIWTFEMAGSLRTSRYATGFYSVYKDVLCFGQNVVERSRWLPWEARHFDAMGIGCDLSKRPMMSNREAALWLANRSASLVLERLPWEVRWELRRWLRRGGHERALHGHPQAQVTTTNPAEQARYGDKTVAP